MLAAALWVTPRFDKGPPLATIPKALARLVQDASNRAGAQRGELLVVVGRQRAGPNSRPSFP